jgi:nucleotide-binding universal stress UspA family protein
MSSIVVGIDGSDTSYRALAMAIGFALRDDGCIHACFVDHLPATASLGGLFVPVPVVANPVNDEQLARYVTEELFNARVGGDFTFCSGETCPELELLAETCKADLIVVGRSAHPHLHPGGVPRQLVSRAHFPILVVP